MLSAFVEHISGLAKAPPALVGVMMPVAIYSPYPPPRRTAAKPLDSSCMFLLRSFQFGGRALATTYIILPFTIAKRGGKLEARPRQEAKTAERAIAAAERIAGQVVGVVVLEETSDPAQDIYAEPKLLHVIGRVPDELTASPAA